MTKRPALEADPCRVARVERAVLSQVRDVVPGVAGSRKAVEPDDPVADDVHVPLGDRRELAPEVVERVAVEPPGAGLELRGVDEVRRADLGHVHLQRRMLAHEHSRGPRMVEVDVGEKKVAKVGQGEAARGQAFLQGRKQLVGPQSKSAGPSSVSSR